MVGTRMVGTISSPLLKFAIPPQGLVNLANQVAIGFVLMAVAVSWMARREGFSP